MAWYDEVRVVYYFKLGLCVVVVLAMLEEKERR